MPDLEGQGASDCALDRSLFRSGKIADYACTLAHLTVLQSDLWPKAFGQDLERLAVPGVILKQALVGRQLTTQQVLKQSAYRSKVLDRGFHKPQHMPMALQSDTDAQKKWTSPQRVHIRPQNNRLLAVKSARVKHLQSVPTNPMQARPILGFGKRPYGGNR